MPYIRIESRTHLDKFIEELVDEIPLDEHGSPEIGHVNYTVTKLILMLLEKGAKDYAAYNNYVGVLECVKQEFYRRAVATYEDLKKEARGDVY